LAAALIYTLAGINQLLDENIDSKVGHYLYEGPLPANTQDI